MRIAFWGQFGTGNFGNECTLYAMLANARLHASSPDFFSVCCQPADTSQRHGLPAVAISSDPNLGLRTPSPHLPKFQRVLREIGDCVKAFRAMRATDLLVMTGTGMLTDNHEGLFGIPYQILKWTLAARLRGARVAFVSIGTESVRSRMKGRMIGMALRLAGYRSFRDALSRDRALALTPCVQNDPIVPDLAFSIPRQLISEVSRHDAGARTVAVGLYAVESGERSFDLYVEAIGSFVIWLMDRGNRVQIVIGDAEYDGVARAAVRAWLAARNRVESVIDEPANSFEELLAQLGPADLVVATRFHNLQLSLLLGKPVISASHEAKNDQLMAAVGLDDFRMPLAAITADALIDRFLVLETQSDSLRATVRSRTEGYRARLDEQYATVFASAPQEPSRG